MNNKTQSHVKLRLNFCSLTIFCFLFLCSVCTSFAFGQTTEIIDNRLKDNELFEQFVKANGYQGVISFDAANIKQFWIDNSVISKDELISISLDQITFKSQPLKIQLANVNETMDCRIDVMMDKPDISFSVLDNSLKKIADSSNGEDFIQNYIVSSNFHLEDTKGLSFYIQFQSIQAEPVIIKKILLSFSKNYNSMFLASPGTLKITNKLVSFSNATERSGEQGFEATGYNTELYSINNILVSDNPINMSVKIKNTGTKPTRIYLGYAVYSKNGILLSGNNYPYNNINKILYIISSEEGSDKIIVDSMPEWAKNCQLALNAQEDLSDIPNTSFADGKIANIKLLSNGHAEITMDQPLKKALKTGMQVRITGVAGAYFYTNVRDFQPDKEEILNSSICKDNSCIQYSSGASNTLPKGAYHIKPLILSYSTNSKEDNTILISDFLVSF